MGFEIHTFQVTSGAVHTSIQYMYMYIAYVHTCSIQNEILDCSKQVYPDKVREINEKLVFTHSVGFFAYLKQIRFHNSVGCAMLQPGASHQASLHVHVPHGFIYHPHKIVPLHWSSVTTVRCDSHTLNSQKQHKPCILVYVYIQCTCTSVNLSHKDVHVHEYHTLNPLRCVHVRRWSQSKCSAKKIHVTCTYIAHAHWCMYKYTCMYMYTSLTIL